MQGCEEFFWLKIILHVKERSIIVFNSHGAAQISGLIKDDTARQFDGIRQIVFHGKPLETTIFAGSAEESR